MQTGGWRKSANWQSKVKGFARACARACRGGGKNKAARIETTASAYLKKLYAVEEKVLHSLEVLQALASTPGLVVKLSELSGDHDLLIKHIFLISDRLLITTDQYGLMHDYKIMSGGDEAGEVAPLADRLLQKLDQGSIASISFERGFSSIGNRELLEFCLPTTDVIMPKKGKLSAQDAERQSQKRWRVLAGAHSAVESNINSLEHHGLNRCPDKGYQAYARYAGLGILAYNLHRIGSLA